MGEGSMNHRPLEFGVGCFNFGVSDSVPKNLTVAQYVTNVKSSLEAIHSINNISVEYLDDDDAELKFNDYIPSLEKDNVFVPHLHFFSVSFDIFIPSRVQREVTKHMSSGEAATERFRVYCQNEFDCPVTFVRPLTDEPDGSPSSSVIIVREYLRAEFQKLDGFVTFNCLGPSPFHVDFRLCPNLENPGGIFEANVLPTRAYNEVEISYDPRELDSVEVAFEALRDPLGNELDVFYEIVRTRNERSHAWVGLQEIMEELVAEEDLSLWGQFQALRYRRRQIHYAHQRLAEFESLRVFSQQRLQKLVNDLYKSGDPAILKSEVEAEFEELEDLPTGELGRLLAFVENRRSKSLEMGIVLLSAMLGGAAGSIITRLVG